MKVSPLALMRFVNTSVNTGHVFPGVKGYEPYEPNDAMHTPWAHAWGYAVATGLGYAEGVTYRNNTWHAHAWCVTDDGAVIETRDGFDDATEYRGWQLDTNAVAAVLLSSGQPLTDSFLAAALDTDKTLWKQVIERFTFVPGTA